MNRKYALEKYGLSEEELNAGIDVVAKSFGQITNPNVMLAVADILATGDINSSAIIEQLEYEISEKDKQIAHLHRSVQGYTHGCEGTD